MKVDFDSLSADKFIIKGRGELHVAILIENMRREGYELQVSRPHVIMKNIDGKDNEPFEEIIIDVPKEFQGSIIEKLSLRGGKLIDMKQEGERTFMTFEGPTRGLIGYRNQFIVDTKGEGILASRVIDYRPYIGEIEHRKVGSMISGCTGKALAYTLDNLQTRGTLYIGANTEVYEGMVIGNTSKGVQLTVNPLKGKNLTNVRSSSSDDAINLSQPQLLTIESGLEIMDKDEYLEVTPESVRLRKEHLKEIDRTRARREKQ